MPAPAPVSTPTPATATTICEWDCGWYAGGKAYVDDEAVSVDKVDLRKIDKARFEQSNLDRRIKAAVLVDPGLAQAFDSQSLKDIAIPMSFINLGRPGRSRQP